MLPVFSSALNFYSINIQSKMKKGRLNKGPFVQLINKCVGYQVEAKSGITISQYQERVHYYKSLASFLNYCQQLALEIDDLCESITPDIRDKGKKIALHIQNQVFKGFKELLFAQKLFTKGSIVSAGIQELGLENLCYIHSNQNVCLCLFI